MKSLPETSRDSLRSTTKILQAVTASMAAAAIIGSIVIVGLVPEALNSDPSMLVMLAAFTGMVSYGLSFVVAAIFKSPVLSDETPTDAQVKKAASQIASSHVTRSAIIEGGVFLNLMVLLLERNFISVAVIALGFLLLCVLFPTHGRFVNAISRRLK